MEALGQRSAALPFSQKWIFIRSWKAG